MTAKEIFTAIRAMGGDVDENTIDTCKAGDPDTAVTKLAVCFIATPQVIREAMAWGAQMLLTHEPTFYTNDDTADNDAVTLAKKALVRDSGLVICRYHDGMHTAVPDQIHDGFVKTLALDGAMIDPRHIKLHTSLTAEELALLVQTQCGLRCVRAVGDVHHPIQTLGLYLGAPSGEDVLRDLKDGVSDAVVIGEVCEWSIGEYVRDAAELGFHKSLLILGHVGSERDGMARLAEKLREMFVNVDVRYLECDEIYC